MKKILWFVIPLVAIAVTGCELDNDKGRNLNFDNASRYTVTVVPRTTEWSGFTLGTGENRKLENIENPDFTWRPFDKVDLGASSSERNVIFVDRAPTYDPNPEPDIIIVPGN